MQFRDAIIEDLPVIVAIYNSNIAGGLVTADTEPVSVEEKKAWFNLHNNKTRPLWIIEDKNYKIIGWASFQDFYGRPAYVGTAEISIYLAENERGKGYGKRILEHCIEKCPAMFIHTLLGFIFAQNTNSLRLFSKSCFEEWAHLKDVAEINGNPCSLKIFGKKIF